MGEQPGDFDTARGEVFSITVPEDVVSDRVDRYLADAIPRLSRARILDLFEDECITVNGLQWRPSRRVKGGERIVVSVPPIISKIEPAPMEFRVLYEDAELAVIDKPAGIIVHPGAGTSEPTLVNGLLHRYPELTGVGDPDRPGIVHRLDKDTSGCLVVARTDETRRRLISMFACRRVHKEYYALVKGVPQQDQFTIDKEIGRSIHDRKRMSIRTHFGREAVTHATAVETFGAAASALAVRIETGRTHQIRVHLAYAGLPVLGDNVYGRAAHEMSVAAGAARQMLHAHKISFAHPSLQKELVIVSPVPEDMRGVEARLREKYCFSNDPR